MSKSVHRVFLILGLLLPGIAAPQSLGSAIDGLAADRLERQVERDLIDEMERSVEAGVDDAVTKQVENDVARAIESQVESAVDEQVTEELTDAVEAGLEATIGADLDGLAVPNVELNVDAGALGSDLTDRFVSAIDENGYEIERDTLLLLADAGTAAVIDSMGYSVRDRRALAAVGGVLFRIELPRGQTQAEVAARLGAGVEVDFNHLYRPATTRPDNYGPRKMRTPARECADDTGQRPVIGLIDTAVASGHPALVQMSLVQADFARAEAGHVNAHGTAVASVLAANMPGARLCAAAVFFEDEAGNAAATTASLVAAIDWLAGGGARVINMSLAGPPNALLETAIQRAVDRGAVVVAAVGNAGPASARLYPAAYPAVIGVTAVDNVRRVFRYANRGPQVSFAAPGVRVRVADAAGGWREESGTSIAAPYASAMVARRLAATGESAEAVVAALKSDAIDLGERGFDEVFGFGLLDTAAR